MSRIMPDEKPQRKMKTDSEVFVVKYNSDGNFCMSGHSDRTVKVSSSLSFDTVMKLWNAKKGTLIKHFSGLHNREVLDIAM